MADAIVPINPDQNLPDHARRMQDLLGGISNIADTIQEAGGVASQFPFLGINNDGVWAFGQERREVEEGSLWAIDVRSLKHGYIAWPPNTAKERKPLGERMVPANEQLPDVKSLPDVGVAYQVQFAFDIICMSGEDKGTVALYKNGSYGAKALIQTLVDELRKQARINPTLLCPVVVLAIRSYVHPEWKKTIYNPVLQIQKWISFDEYDAFDRVGSPPLQIVNAAEPEPAPAVKPRAAARGTGRAAPAPAPEPTPTPKPRRPRVQPSA